MKRFPSTMINFNNNQLVRKICSDSSARLWINASSLVILSFCTNHPHLIASTHTHSFHCLLYLKFVHLFTSNYMKCAPFFHLYIILQFTCFFFLNHLTLDYSSLCAPSLVLLSCRHVSCTFCAERERKHLSCYQKDETKWIL